ncbi:MAG: two-component system sensor histidine kinase NtrB [Nitrospinales bacterium]
MPKIKEIPDKELLKRVKTILVLRVIFLTGFVGLIFAFLRNVEYEMPVGHLSVAVGAAYFLSAVYALLLRLKTSHKLLSSIQISGDLLVVGGIIFSTGGIGSPLSFLFILIIIEASLLLPRAACYMAASGASIIYGLLLDLEYYKVIQPIYLTPRLGFSIEGAYVFYIIALNVASFYSVAFLSSILTHRMKLIKEELKSKSLDLQRLQEFHKNVVQNMGNGLITTDPSGLITSVNTASERITGYSAEECLGKLSYEVLEITSLKKFFLEGHNFNLPVQIEGKCSRKDETTILIGIKISRLDEYGDQPAGYICVFEDLSEIREMEEKVKQGEQLAAVGRFSAGLAHEVRNPLASLSGSIQVLKKGLNLEGDYKSLMNIVLKETERLNHIVTGFLNYSQPTKNKSNVIDMTQLLKDAITLMKNSDKYHPAITFVLDTQNESTLTTGDEDAIKQLVWNLCLNGMQAMKNGGALTLSLNKINKNGGIMLKVKDEGCGMDPEQIKSIFDPFFTTKEDGVGLGLATVYQIVHRCGYNIDVDSEPGKGTQFTIFIPRIDQSAVLN